MKRSVLLLLLAALLPLTAPAQTLARKGWAGSGIQVAPWYRQAIFYQIDPISFADSNGDGFGDLNGITAHLDYVESLNVDAILLSPLALEPAYARDGSGPAFDRIYGTLDDLDQLIAAASSHHLRVLVDLRLDQARSPAEAAATARFWLAHGVGGLHVLAAAPGTAPHLDGNYAEQLAEVRHVVETAAGQRVLLLDAQAPRHVVASHHQRLAPPQASAAELTVDPALMPATLNPASIAAGLASLGKSYPAVRTDSPDRIDRPDRTDIPDRARSFDRNPAANPATLARSLAMILLTTPAAPILYFGQELGMRATPVLPGVPAPGSPRNVGPGDAGEPTPMQWDPSLTPPNGFSTATPWIAMAADTVTANVSTEDADPASLLNWYRTLDRLRHTQASLRDGSFTLVDSGIPGVLAWVRLGARVGGTSSAPVLVLVNLTAQSMSVSPREPLRRAGLNVPQTPAMKTLARSNQPQPEGPSASSIALEPFGCYAGELTTQRGLESVATPVKRSRRSGR